MTESQTIAAQASCCQNCPCPGRLSKLEKTVGRIRLWLFIALGVLILLVGIAIGRHHMGRDMHQGGPRGDGPREGGPREGGPREGGPRVGGPQGGPMGGRMGGPGMGGPQRGQMGGQMGGPMGRSPMAGPGPGAGGQQRGPQAGGGMRGPGMDGPPPNGDQRAPKQRKDTKDRKVERGEDRD